MKTNGLFVTGTDTDVGKTWATIALMRRLQNQGLLVNALKPVAAGCVEQAGQLGNPDAWLLQKFSSKSFEYYEINPYAFAKAASPHYACEGVSVDPEVIIKSYKKLDSQSEFVVVEGAGGWFSPVDQRWLNADLAKCLGLPVLLVVGLRLGCINHALLTAQAIKESGLGCLAWLAVVLDPDMEAIQSNLEYLSDRLDIPCLGVLPNLKQADFDFLAETISLDRLKIDLDQKKHRLSV